MQKLPGRVNQNFNKLLNEQFEICIHAFDETAFLSNMQKIANRMKLTRNEQLFQLEKFDFLDYDMVYHAHTPKQQQTSMAQCIWLQWIIT